MLWVGGLQFYAARSGKASWRKRCMTRRKRESEPCKDEGKALGAVGMASAKAQRLWSSRSSKEPQVAAAEGQEASKRRWGQSRTGQMAGVCAGL